LREVNDLTAEKDIGPQATTDRGGVGEDRHGDVSEIDAMQAAVEEAFRARIPHMNNAEMIEEANRLNNMLFKPDIEVGSHQKKCHRRNAYCHAPRDGAKVGRSYTRAGKTD
jgi:hypothetical protein